MCAVRYPGCCCTDYKPNVFFRCEGDKKKRALNERATARRSGCYLNCHKSLVSGQRESEVAAKQEGGFVSHWL